MNVLGISMVCLSVLFLYFIVRLIKKATFTLEYSLLWLFVGIVMLVFSIFPQIPTFLSILLGFETMSNFLLVMAVLFIIAQLIMFTKYNTKQRNDIKTLIQEVSILKEKIEREDKKS